MTIQNPILPSDVIYHEMDVTYYEIQFWEAYDSSDGKWCSYGNRDNLKDASSTIRRVRAACPNLIWRIVKIVQTFVDESDYAGL